MDNPKTNQYYLNRIILDLEFVIAHGLIDNREINIAIFMHDTVAKTFHSAPRDRWMLLLKNYGKFVRIFRDLD